MDDEKGKINGSHSGSPHEQDRSVISTADSVVVTGGGQQAEWRDRPDATLVAETSGVDRAIPAYLVPVSKSEPKPRSHEGPQRDQREENERAPHADREAPRPSPWRNALISAGVGLAAGLIGAGILLYFFGPSKSESSQTPSRGQSGARTKARSEDRSSSKGSDKGTGADETSQSGSAIPGFTRAEDADTLRRQIEHLAERIDQLGQRLDTLPPLRDQVPPDLRTLQIRVGDLSRTIGEVGNLPSRFRRLESRFEVSQQELKTLRDRVSLSHEREAAGVSEENTMPAAVTARPLVAITPPSAVEDQADVAWAQGVALFRSGNYPEASNVFRQLQVTRPADARVWYYSALAVGMTTGDWNHSARELVERGIKCERAGMPERNQIDVAFTGLTESQGRKWLNTYRGQANLR